VSKLDSELDLSIVLPIFNEQDNIRSETSRIVSAMEASPYSYEIIVVDDGSTDSSAEILATLPEIRTIYLGTNSGTGVARKFGTLASRGRIVVWTDVDMTYPNDQIPALVAALGKFDQVVGQRDSERGTRKIARVPAKWFIKGLASYLAKVPIPDLNSGFRAFRREVGVQFLHQLPPGFSCVSTMTMSFLSNGYTVGYIPIKYAQRSGISKFHWWRDTRRYLTQVIRMILSYEPLRVFVPLGLAILALAIAKLAIDWISRDFHLSTNTLLLFVGAFQTITLGFLADLVVRSSRKSALVKPANVVESPPIRNPVDQLDMIVASPSDVADIPVRIQKRAL
jgi:polyisoprenyl-phosphate glycosyltransferase